ncbi:MAG: hypothetical protein EZS28_001581 [Streblomastix strix]|uniref:Uncharacterized protein n=1 Tax=Streblomastix strix TaxID=222440 RepID=A0A5J4X8N2_9EUKA|nr:MAG: hypothetical protein EZS28_001581 [Streblomastix strix]
MALQELVMHGDVSEALINRNNTNVKQLNDTLKYLNVKDRANEKIIFDLQFVLDSRERKHSEIEKQYEKEISVLREQVFQKFRLGDPYQAGNFDQMNAKSFLSDLLGKEFNPEDTIEQIAKKVKIAFDNMKKDFQEEKQELQNRMQKQIDDGDMEIKMLRMYCERLKKEVEDMKEKERSLIEVQRDQMNQLRQAENRIKDLQGLGETRGRIKQLENDKLDLLTERDNLKKEIERLMKENEMESSRSESLSSRIKRLKEMGIGDGENNGKSPRINLLMGNELINKTYQSKETETELQAKDIQGLDQIQNMVQIQKNEWKFMQERLQSMTDEKVALEKMLRMKESAGVLGNMNQKQQDNQSLNQKKDEYQKQQQMNMYGDAMIEVKKKEEWEIQKQNMQRELYIQSCQNEILQRKLRRTELKMQQNEESKQNQGKVGLRWEFDQDKLMKEEQELERRVTAARLLWAGQGYQWNKDGKQFEQDNKQEKKYVIDEYGFSAEVKVRKDEIEQMDQNEGEQENEQILGARWLTGEKRKEVEKKKREKGNSDKKRIKGEILLLGYDMGEYEFEDEKEKEDEKSSYVEKQAETPKVEIQIMTSKPINEPPQKKETFLDRVERKAREASVKISRMRERMEFDEKLKDYKVHLV